MRRLVVLPAVVAMAVAMAIPAVAEVDALRTEPDRVVVWTESGVVAIDPEGRGLGPSAEGSDTEVVPVSQVEGFPWGGDTEVSEREIAMAQQLIASMTSAFDPDRYKDEHLERVRELAEAKATGEEVVTPETSGHRAEVVDLTAALEKSLSEAQRRRQEAG